MAAQSGAQIMAPSPTINATRMFAPPVVRLSVNLLTESSPMEMAFASFLRIRGACGFTGNREIRAQPVVSDLTFRALAK